MTAPNRVDELRKRYHENPRRFFAPLANEYRKTGFVDRAILLCEKHLGEQPGNMNGLVVYGQCLFETGRLDDARVPFEMALGLDPENLIALRHLGDIARLGGDQASARNWYQRLLEFDRRNDEVIALLAEVGGGRAESPERLSQAPGIISVASSVSVAGAAEAAEMIDLEPEAPAVPAPRAATPPRVDAVPPRATTPVDPSAKTVEVTARPRSTPQAPTRASIFDVSFDFGDIAEAPTPPAPVAPEPLLPAEAAEYGFAAPEPAPSVEDALDDLLEEAPSAAEPATGPATQPNAPLAMSPLVDSSPEGESLGELAPIDGLLQADFSADVAPLADLESTEFESGDATPLAELEASDFQPPARDTAALEGLETTEFTPPSFSAVPASRLSSDIEVAPDDAFGLLMPEEPATAPDAPEFDASEFDASAFDATEFDAPAVDEEPSARIDARASVAGLPLLEPLGSPTPLDTPTVDDLPLLPSLEEADTLRIDVETLRERMATPATFVTETMAQVYVQQGHTDKAIAVYKQLIAQAPDDVQLRERLRALEAPTPEPVSTPPALDVPPPARPSLGFDTPATTESVDEPAPADAMLSAMSFDGVSLSTPATPSRRETPALATERPTGVSEAVVSGPSAREFFSRFARRAVTPGSAPVVTAGASAAGALLSPLDEVFGTTVSPEDEAAAHRLAGVGATSGPSGGSALDSLFGEGPSAPMPTATPARGSVTRASEKLRFDQFFASSTPVEGSAAPAAPAARAEADLPMDAADETEAEAEASGEDDDLDQFQGWLRGLTS